MSEDDDFFNFVDLSKKRYVSDDTRDKMAFARTLTLSEIIKRFKLVHGNRYDYSKVNYVHSEQKVTIICSVHGEFFQSPTAHWKGQGCSKCAGAKIGKEKSDLIRNTLIDDFKSVHGDKYDYSKVIYVKQNVKVIVICPEHGEFLVNPAVHKRGKRGSHCPSCKTLSKIHKPKLSSPERKLWLLEKREINKQKFLDASRKRHGDKYDYSRVEYVNANTNVEIICPEHGVFSQKPSHFVTMSKGCPKCLGYGLSNEDVISNFRERHGDKYDYSKVDYQGARAKVTIICRMHGEFQQLPSLHLVTSESCPKCRKKT